MNEAFIPMLYSFDLWQPEQTAPTSNAALLFSLLFFMSTNNLLILVISHLPLCGKKCMFESEVLVMITVKTWVI